ncbi:DUF3307 domain-containing protein [Psychrobium sp. MM17-31]|uniref:DUF3307 domain-containing protein n=1 Tax=Psychrobium sp. MM17-31 TaxID=2917758 RepID=UPI001EF46D89|nr:DUF3307 domain-containing protein [Psychrobium sp. MM17-31]MCG7531646.1 DUF3307 domain-containing protein [Psychrobium sp. MM17-31]
MDKLWLTFGGLMIMQIFVQFYCQPRQWREEQTRRGIKSLALVKYSIAQAVFASVVILFVTQDLQSILTLVIVLSISHWLIGCILLLSRNKVRVLLITQALQCLILVLIAFHVCGVELSTILSPLVDKLHGKHLAVLIAYLLVLKPTSLLISSVLVKYSPIDKNKNEGLIAGGEIIGYLERLLILTFVLIGQYAVIGFILAAKSIFRFGELNKESDRNLTEYVLLGSLLSVTITSMIGLGAKFILAA